jgi:hypothetical protein
MWPGTESPPFNVYRCPAHTHTTAPINSQAKKKNCAVNNGLLLHMPLFYQATGTMAAHCTARAGKFSAHPPQLRRAHPPQALSLLCDFGGWGPCSAATLARLEHADASATPPPSPSLATPPLPTLNFYSSWALNKTCVLTRPCLGWLRRHPFRS